MIPVKKKEAVLIMYRQGRKYKEISDTLLLSPNTVKSICRRSGPRPLQPEEQKAGLCQNCGTPMPQSPHAKKKIFCCDRCRYAWWNKKRGLEPYRLVCCCCGREFVSFGNRNRKYCGRECYLRSRYGEGLP